VSNAHVPARSLREHPDLNQLKRQAKELLAGHRSGDADAVAEIKHHYRDADPTTFALHDAQLVLARAHGFDSWPKLKAFVDGATVSRLIEAVRAGDLARVEAMLDARPEIVNMDARYDDEHRALHHAVLMRAPDMVRLLMSRGADADIGIYPHRVPTTARAIATERGYDEIVAIIDEAEQQKSGFQPKMRADAPATPEMPPELQDAIARGDSAAAIAFLEASPLLRENPALISMQGPGGITMLHLAAARVMLPLGVWLLEHGADVHPRNDPGFAPIDMLGRWPVRHPHDDLQAFADLLFQHGAKPSAFSAIALNDLDWLRARYSEGTLRNRVIDVGGLVTFAVRLDRREALDLLLDLGFDPNEHPSRGPGAPRPDPDFIGKPLEYCACEQRMELATVLVQRGATMSASMAVALGMGDWLRARHTERRLAHPPEGDGLLTVAVEHGRADMLQLLLELGFDAEETRRRVGGDSVHEGRGVPLDRCVSKGNREMAEILLAHGANPNSPCEHGGTPMANAYGRGDRAMLDLLAQHGGVVDAGTAAYHRDTAIARQRILEEDAGTLPPGAVSPGRTVAEDLLAGECGEPEIIRMALERIDWPADDPRWYGTLKGPLSFWSHIPWTGSRDKNLPRDGYLASFTLILARCHANVRGSFGRSILHDVMAMGFHDGESGWVSDEEALAFAITLLDAGARTDVRDDLLRSTPLGWACRWGRTPIVKELLRRGVDSVEADAEPWATPRAWAEKMRHREILAMLEQAPGLRPEA
jgi:ankyrin repeat protein